MTSPSTICPPNLKIEKTYSLSSKVQTNKFGLKQKLIIFTKKKIKNLMVLPISVL
jgi:hypothetical protein